MAADIPAEVAQQLLKAVNSMRRMVDELRPFIAAVQIQNRPFNAEASHVADLDVIQISLENREQRVLST